MENITLKKGTEKEWQEAVDKNKDGYGKAVIDVVIKVCAELDKGKSPQEAETIGIKGSGITGFQAGAMASMINHFHPKGEEFREYFNKENGETGQEKGVINPAILTIKSNKT
jgi:hypothetical protein